MVVPRELDGESARFTFTKIQCVDDFWGPFYHFNPEAPIFPIYFFPAKGQCWCTRRWMLHRVVALARSDVFVHAQSGRPRPTASLWRHRPRRRWAHAAPIGNPPCCVVPNHHLGSPGHIQHHTKGKTKKGNVQKWKVSGQHVTRLPMYIHVSSRITG